MDAAHGVLDWLGAEKVPPRQPAPAKATTLPRRLAMSGYDAATLGYRLRSLIAPNYGPNTAIASAGDQPRARINALARNNVWAEQMLSAWAGITVGTGVQAQSKYTSPRDRKGRGLLTEEEEEAKRQELNALFLDWWDEADADGVNSLGGLQWLVARGVRQTGDVFARLRPRFLEDGLPVPLQVQLLTSEFCPYSLNKTLENGNRIICGIEFNRIGKKVAYYLYTEHPNEATSTGLETVRVPAEAVIHCFHRKLPGQVRGEWALIRAIMLLNDVDEYEAAELWRKKGAAMFGGLIYAPDASKAPALFGDPPEVTDDDETTQTGEKFGTKAFQAAVQAMAAIEISPGTWPILPPGFDIKNHEPADVGPNFGAFMRWAMLKAAKAGGLTFEQLTGDMSGVNYSSARVARLDQQRNDVEPWVWEVIIHQFCRPVHHAFVDAAVYSNAIDLPGYAQGRRAAQRVTFHPQGYQLIDPLKEIQAAILAIRAGLKSPQMVINELGFNPLDVEREINEWNARADRDGRVATTDPRQVTESGVAVGKTLPGPTDDADNGEKPDAGDKTDQQAAAAAGGSRG